VASGHDIISPGCYRFAYLRCMVVCVQALQSVGKPPDDLVTPAFAGRPCMSRERCTSDLQDSIIQPSVSSTTQPTPRRSHARSPLLLSAFALVLTACLWSCYDTIRDAILTCAPKPTRVSLIYRTEPTTEKWKTEKTKM